MINLCPEALRIVAMGQGLGGALWEQAVPGLKWAAASWAVRCSQSQEWKGVEAASFFYNKSKTVSSLTTELANGILFPHNNLLLILPSPGPQV